MERYLPMYIRHVRREEQGKQSWKIYILYVCCLVYLFDHHNSAASRSLSPSISFMYILLFRFWLYTACLLGGRLCEVIKAESNMVSRWCFRQSKKNHIYVWDINTSGMSTYLDGNFSETSFNEPGNLGGSVVGENQSKRQLPWLRIAVGRCLWSMRLMD